MLTDDDKKWFAEEMSAAGTGHLEPLAEREQRITDRLDKFEARLIAEFQKWTLPTSDHPRVEAAAHRSTQLELKAFLNGVGKLGS